jgi:hypothetical protein
VFCSFLFFHSSFNFFLSFVGFIFVRCVSFGSLVGSFAGWLVVRCFFVLRSFVHLFGSFFRWVLCSFVGVVLVRWFGFLAGFMDKALIYAIGAM